MDMKKHFFVLILPVIWAVTFIVPYYGQVGGILEGVIGMALVGWLFEKLQVKPLKWFVLWIFFSIMVFILPLLEYTKLEKILCKSGSGIVYIAASLNFALYVSVIFAALAALIILITKKYKFV
jgi:hypothetical protein